MTNNPKNTPDWFSTEIRTGLASLYVLCLDGSPANDHAGMTTSVWIETLWRSPRRLWSAQADVPCIRAAFARLRGACRRWPAPAEFWDNLPAREETNARGLPAKVFTLDERRENLRRFAEEGRRALGIEPKSDEAGQ